MLALFTVASSTQAASISSTHNFAWGNVGGWINLAPSNGGVSVTDTALSGYAWSANDGWINLSPSTGGVKNDGAGTLSGFAWDSSVGWVAFSGVTIDASGRFHGQASGANGYVINFDCAQCDVETAWRPTAIPTPTPALASSGGGGTVSGSLAVGYVNNDVTSSVAAVAVATPSASEVVPVESPHTTSVPASGAYPMSNTQPQSLREMGGTQVIASTSVGNSHLGISGAPRAITHIPSSQPMSTHTGFIQKHFDAVYMLVSSIIAFISNIASLFKWPWR